MRRRIGRGGRVIYDRHQSNLNLDPKWKFDNYDEDVDEMIVEMQEDPRFILFRAFNLAPSSEQECRSLMNKPYFPDQINVVPITREQRLANQAALAAAAPQVVVAPPPKKRPPRTNEQKNIKKKVVPELDPRQAAVKAFLAASQKQASQNTVNPPSQFIRPSGSPGILI